MCLKRGRLHNHYYEYIFDEQFNWIKKYAYYSNPRDNTSDIEGFYEEREIFYFE